MFIDKHKESAESNQQKAIEFVKAGCPDYSTKASQLRIEELKAEHSKINIGKRKYRSIASLIENTKDEEKIQNNYKDCMCKLASQCKKSTNIVDFYYAHCDGLGNLSATYIDERRHVEVESM